MKFADTNDKSIKAYCVGKDSGFEKSSTFDAATKEWIKQNKFRDILPNIELVEGDEVISGILEYPELGLVLSEDLISKEWPKVSQTKSLEVISKEYDEFIYPMILLADPILKNSLEYIKITPTNMTPTKHYGYSAQWFLMFSVLCLMYVFYGFKRNAK